MLTAAIALCNFFFLTFMQVVYSNRGNLCLDAKVEPKVIKDKPELPGASLHHAATVITDYTVHSLRSKSLFHWLHTFNFFKTSCCSCNIR